MDHEFYEKLLYQKQLVYSEMGDSSSLWIWLRWKFVALSQYQMSSRSQIFLLLFYRVLCDTWIVRKRSHDYNYNM